MLVQRTAIRMAVAALSALALAATASPALGGGGPEDLVHGEEQQVGGIDRFVYDQEFNYWAVTALRSDGGKTRRLYLYADQQRETLLAKSNQGKKKTEFVVADSNHAPVPTTYFPVAGCRGLTCTIELDNDNDILSTGVPTAVDMTEEDVVKAVDVYLEDGVEFVLTVTGEGDGGLYLMQSDGAIESTWFQSRADAAAKSDRRGAGGSETIRVTGTGDWYGLILLNESGGGTYTLTKTIA
jgi:hypothetical protein